MRGLGAFLAVSVSAGLLSAQEPAPAPATQEDRAPIPAMIDTWYRVEQDKESKGYFHELLTTTTMRNYRYDYTVKSEYEWSRKSTTGEEESFVISEDLTAQLEEDFDIFFMDYTLTTGSGRTIIQVRTYPETEERVIKYTIATDPNSPPETREAKVLIAESAHIYLNPMFYKLRQGGSLAQSTRLREKVLIPGQKEPVSVSYATDTMMPKVILDKPVKVTPVRIEGWDRGELAPFTKFWIDKYGRIIEAQTSDDSIVLKFAKDETAAKGSGQPGLTPRGRRDPFSKSGALTAKEAGGVKTGPGTPEDPNKKKFKDLLPEQFDAVFAEAQSLIPQLQDEVSKSLLDDAKRTYLKILQHYRGLYPLSQADVVKRTNVEKLREDAERIYGGVKKQLDIALAKVDRINDLLNALNLDGIDREIRELEAMRTLPEFWRSEEGLATLEQAIRGAQNQRLACQARIELEKKTLILTGTITATEVVQDVVKFDLFIGGARFSLAEPVRVSRIVTYSVINDEAYREGDLIAREGVKVLKIHRHAVEVEYKGEVRQVTLKK
ncbi:MAG TPA: hypothetical protein VK661_04555 [Planctomycetota bacterium]|nr:hypothetical protein [Planctomycetota bacterium]